MIISAKRDQKNNTAECSMKIKVEVSQVPAFGTSLVKFTFSLKFRRYVHFKLGAMQRLRHVFRGDGKGRFA